MNVLIYIPEINQTWGGIRQYASGLIKILALSLDETISFYVYHNSNDSEILGIVQQSNRLTLVTDMDINYIPYIYPSFIKRGINFLRRKIGLDNLKEVLYKTHIELICDKYSIDVIHCPYQFIPNVNGVKLITTLHDVQELHFPEFFTPQERANRAVRWLDYLTRADKIVVSYKHVEQDLIKYFDIASDKIETILLDMNKLWFDDYSDDDMVSLDEYNLPNKFIFYPANTWKHKNHIRLLKAIACIRDNYNIYVNLVCSGHANQHFQDEIESIICELKLSSQIKFIGIVTEPELFTLYKLTVGVVIPTVYEAGSFPLMESILLNVPVICSSVTSLPETINNSICLFNPFDITSIAEKIKHLWLDENFRKETIKNHNLSGNILMERNSLNKLLTVYKYLNL